LETCAVGLSGIAAHFGAVIGILAAVAMIMRSGFDAMLRLIAGWRLRASGAGALGRAGW
jgi:hypothetical protein